MSVEVEIKFTDNESYIIREAEAYASDVELIEKTIRQSVAYRWCLVNSYREFVRSGKLKRINDLDNEMKNELYQRSLKIEPQKVFYKVRVDICRIAWLFNFVFEKYFV